MAKPDFVLLARAETSIGELVLRRRRVQADPGRAVVELFVDDRMLMSDFNTVSERVPTRQRREELFFALGSSPLFGWPASVRYRVGR